MKNKLLLSSLLSLSVLTFSGTAKAQESADATFTATLGTVIEVVKIQDGSATINPTTGDLEGLTNARFSVTSNCMGSTNGIFSTADVSGAPTLGEVIPGDTLIALTNGAPAASAINNALSAAPNAQDNPDVIAYEINVIPDGQPEFTFNGADDTLEGVILTEPGTADVNVEIQPVARPETFSAEDSAGEYTAQMTLTAFSAL